MKSLPIVSNSEMKSFRRCIEEWHLGYLERRRPILRAEALRFGTLCHIGQEHWWRSCGDIELAFSEMAKNRDTDEFHLAKARALLAGYHLRWSEEPYRVLAVEQEFKVPLINPATGHASKTFMLSGKIDAIIQMVADQSIWIVEHKSCGEDIGFGSTYWTRLTLDSQVSTYLIGAKALRTPQFPNGADVVGCLYDVARKPTQRPYEATPPEARKYTEPKSRACKWCGKKNALPPPHDNEVGEGDEMRVLSCVDGRVITDPGGRLHANMREFAETPAEYEERIAAVIAEDPDKFYQRGTVVRTEDMERDAQFDLWHTARMMREAVVAKRFPRNPDACVRWGRDCDYLGVCAGRTSIYDESRFRLALRAHEELEEVA